MRERSRVQAVRRTLPPGEQRARLTLYSTTARRVKAEPVSQIAHDILAESTLRCRKCKHPIVFRETWGPNMTMERKPQMVDGMCPECAWMEGA